MRVAVLGAGAAGLASACVLRGHGHFPILWSHSGKLESGPIRAAGALVARFDVEVAQSVAAAMAGAGAVLITAPGFAHRAIWMPQRRTCARGRPSSSARIRPSVRSTSRSAPPCPSSPGARLSP